MKIWQFENDNAELITSLPIEDKIEKFYAPRTWTAKNMYYIGVFQEMSGFKVYKDKLSEYWHCKDKITATAVDFTLDCTAFLVGTDKGDLNIYEFKDKSNAGEIKVGRGRAINFICVLDDQYALVATEEPAVYACPLVQGSKDPHKLDTNHAQIHCLKTSIDRKHIVIGFADSVIEFWIYKEGTQKFELLKEIKEEFKYFDIDPLCSSMLILNPKGRDIEYHLIEWEWDTTKIDHDLQNINLDFQNIKEEDIKDDFNPKLKINDGKNKKRSQTSCCTLF